MVHQMKTITDAAVDARMSSWKRASIAIEGARVPLSTSDFSSYLLQAQGSGAQVVGLANADADFSNSLKAAHEFGLTETMKPAALLAFITDIHSVGLEMAQGLYLTAAWYRDLNDKSRAFGKRFLDKTGAMPTYNQAAYYSATTTYLNAVKAVGATDADKVMDELRTATSGAPPASTRSS
jgi:branched-chain amino acid transport system substrate-binding protein